MHCLFRVYDISGSSDDDDVDDDDEDSEAETDTSKLAKSTVFYVVCLFIYLNWTVASEYFVSADSAHL